MPLVYDLESIDLLAMIGAETNLARVASTSGGEWAGPCPFCGGRDRLRVWPQHPAGKGKWWCRQCGRHGDALDYIQERDNMSFSEARRALSLASEIVARPVFGAGVTNRGIRPPQPTTPPALAWQRAAGGFVEESSDRLWSLAGEGARNWLRGRGLSEETIQDARLGYNPEDRRLRREEWGFPSNPERPALWLPRGVVIPWCIGDELWRVNIRRPLTQAQVAAGKAKYSGPAGWKNALYNADMLNAAKPAVLVEGELDALIVEQHAGDLVAAVATGSTSGGRGIRWLVKLAQPPLVLVAFDTDKPGETAAQYWLDALPHAKRWRPLWEDACAMAQDGADVRAWIADGLSSLAAGHVPLGRQVARSPDTCQVGKERYYFDKSRR